ncbi:MAG: hypothetical protein Q9187_007016 [Circinaria calcarea]
MAEANKIKNKLNGSILKGSKMQVEEARPDKKSKRSKGEDKPDPEVDSEQKAKNVGRKRKREDGVLPGFELPEERKVKRGWTEPVAGPKNVKTKKIGKDRDKKEKKAKPLPSAFTDSPECLFRTKLPPNVDILSASTSTAHSKLKKRKAANSDRETVVHEFSNTTKHAGFLRDTGVESGKKGVSEFVEGRGWVDGDGNVVEQVKIFETTKPTAGKDELANKNKSNGSSSQSAAQKPSLETVARTHETPDGQGDLDETSSSGISSSSDDSGGSEEEANSFSEGEKAASLTQAKIAIRSSKSTTKPTDDVEANDTFDSSSSSKEVSGPFTKSQIAVHVPPLTIVPTQIPTEVHPLEALFKKPRQTPSGTPRKPNLEVQTSFSFFDADADAKTGNGNSSHAQHAIPQTPFTQQDIQQRRMRSAAPTPDTAAPNKGFGLGFGDDDDLASSEDEENEEDQDDNDTPLSRKDAAVKDAPDADPPQSDFAKWFWEHRGETNRAWKKRRREVAKEQRQRENKRRARSAI